MVGVTVNADKDPEKIRLKVDRKQYNYIKSKPLHNSQKEKEVNDEYALIELKLIPNYEFETLLLTFADGIDILEPESLRKSIHERACKIVNRSMGLLESSLWSSGGEILLSST